MPRDASLFEAANGSVVRGYLLLKQNGGNVPPMWLSRATESRRKRQSHLKQILRKGSIGDIVVLEDWEIAFQKERFYYGIRCLMELERKGRTKL